MNPDLQKLHPYPFERLVKLLDGVTPAADKSAVSLSIGEPQHEADERFLQAMHDDRHRYSKYPFSKGTPELRQSIAAWLQRRFGLGDAGIDAEKHVIPVSGTREALFSIAQAVVDRNTRPVVIMPNPFYQIYERTALLTNAEPYYLNTTAENNYLPDFKSVPEKIWQRCQLIYICSPGNPTGAVIPEEQLLWLMEAAERYDFVIASDECYSEIYPDECNPPVGLLAAAKNAGNSEYKNCLVFHSLSKRSNLAGLRSGFVAGDAEVMSRYLKYRTYHGCALALPTQTASIMAWDDEEHVRKNRDAYREKFQSVIEILSPVLDCKQPDASFYLWPSLPMDDEAFTRRLYEQENVLVLPGSYLSRDTDSGNPGKNHVRIALVAEIATCIDAAKRIKTVLENY